jgi:hypothetical protein
MTFAVNLPGDRYGDPEQRARFHRDLEARLAALPGVRAAGGDLSAAGDRSVPQLGRAATRPAGRITVHARAAARRRRILFRRRRHSTIRGRMFAREDDGRAPRA